MRLKKLLVVNSKIDEVIRKIDFNDKGLSLIVDESLIGESGSNIGKTTAVKVIDLCLGGKSISSLYKEKDTGENYLVKNFLSQNKVIAKLIVIIDNEQHTFTRALYPRGKNEIDSEPTDNINQYREKLNKLIFNNKENKPSLRQLISKFIRLDNNNESALLKYLGSFTKNYEYQAIYSYLYGLNKAKSKNINIFELNNAIDKDIEVIFRKNSVSSLSEFEAKISLMEEEVEKFKNAYREVSVIEEYESKNLEVEMLLLEINNKENDLGRIKLKKDIIIEKIEKEKEKEKNFLIDMRALRLLYDETKLNVEVPLKDFEELKNFHNGMVKKRINMLIDVVKEIESYIIFSERELKLLRKKYENIYVSFNSELKEKYEEKYEEFAINKNKLQIYKCDYEYIIEKQNEKNINLQNKIVEEQDTNVSEDIKSELNKYFKEYTNKIIGETFALLFDEEENEFPIKIIGMNGKPGTGIKKAMITCFDLAHIKLILNREYHMPVFEIHDKLENIDLTELKNIINASRGFKGQYIFPILKDRIEQLNILPCEVVLSLSSDKKFFGI